MNQQLVTKLTKNTAKMLEVEKQILEMTINFRKELASYQEKDVELRQAIQDAMEKTGTKSFENDLLKLTYVAATTRNTFDAKRLETEHPELAQEYRKESPVKANVRITVKTITKRISI